MFWHGRHFGTKSVTFLSIALYKAQLFMVPILMTNLTNGFSGIAIYTDLYYAMFDVLNTVFILAAFLILDQDVAFNTERYNNDDQDIQQIKDSPI